MKNEFVVEFTSGGSGARQDMGYHFSWFKGDIYLTSTEYSEYELPIESGMELVVKENYLTLKREGYDFNGKSKMNLKQTQLKRKPLKNYRR